MQLTLDDVARFLSKLKETPNGCWEYQAGKHKDGYGLFYVEGKSHLAHRIAFELFKGPLGDLQSLHSCDNPPCCNPLHLFAGTHQDNMKDRDNKKRLPTRRGEGNSNAQITWKTVHQLRQVGNCGLFSRIEVAIMFGLSYYIVSDVLNNRSWKED